MRIRLNPDERRQQIIEAAMPLFARQGFRGTTTKQIAEAAKVSEGLLFKYFANKTALYDAIITYCFDEDDARFPALQSLAPSTATLAVIVHEVVEYFVGLKRRGAHKQSRQRLLLQSLVEDGEFARMAMRTFSEAMAPLMERSLAAAGQAGHLEAPIAAPRAFWMAAMLQIMLGAFALHDDMMPGDELAPDAQTAEATRFILRGMGVKPQAIDAVYPPYVTARTTGVAALTPVATGRPQPHHVI